MPVKRKRLEKHDGKWRRSRGMHHANRPVRKFVLGWRESFSRAALRLLHREKVPKFQPIPVQERPWVPKNKPSTYVAPPVVHPSHEAVLKRSRNRKLVSWATYNPDTRRYDLYREWWIRFSQPWGDIWVVENKQ